MQRLALFYNLYYYYTISAAFRQLAVILLHESVEISHRSALNGVTDEIRTRTKRFTFSDATITSRPHESTLGCSIPHQDPYCSGQCTFMWSRLVVTIHALRFEKAEISID